jgi:hypothetical protein
VREGGTAGAAARARRPVDCRRAGAAVPQAAGPAPRVRACVRAFVRESVPRLWEGVRHVPGEAVVKHGRRLGAQLAHVCRAERAPPLPRPAQGRAGRRLEARGAGAGDVSGPAGRRQARQRAASRVRAADPGAGGDAAAMPSQWPILWTHLGIRQSRNRDKEAEAHQEQPGGPACPAHPLGGSGTAFWAIPQAICYRALGVDEITDLWQKNGVSERWIIIIGSALRWPAGLLATTAVGARK